MTDLKIGVDERGHPYRRSVPQMLRNALYEGASNTGKTTIIAEQADTLFWSVPKLPILVLDGVGTLARDLHSRLLWGCDHLATRGVDVGTIAARIRFLSIAAKNTSGLSFNLLRLRMTEDDMGPRRQTYQEVVEALVGTLTHTTEDSDSFMLVRRYAPAAFTLLTAAHRPPTELVHLLESPLSGEGYYHRLLAEARSFQEADLSAARDDDSYYQMQIRKLRNLYMDFGSNPIQFQSQVGSTLRHFDWLTTQFASYFSGNGMDYGDFHDAGGVLLVESRHPDPAAAGIVRRLLYGLRYGHVQQRAVDTPTLAIVDEQHGMNAVLYAKLLVNARNRNDVQWFSFQNGEQIGERGSEYNTFCAAMRTLVYFRPEGPDAADRVVRRINRMDPEAMILMRRGTSDRSGSQSSWRTSSGTSDQRGRSLQLSDDDGVRELLRTRGVIGDDSATVRTELVKEESLTPASRRRGISQQLGYSESRDEGGGTSSARGRSTQEERVGLHEQLQIHSRQLLGLPLATAYWIEEHAPAVLVRHVAPRMRFDPERAKRGRIEQAQQLGTPQRIPPLDFTIMPRSEKKKAKAAPVSAPVAATAPGSLERKKPVRKKKVDAPEGGTA